MLFHEHGQSYEEIADVVGRPVGTVKTWLHRARLHVLAELAPPRPRPRPDRRSRTRETDHDARHATTRRPPRARPAGRMCRVRGCAATRSSTGTWGRTLWTATTPPAVPSAGRWPWPRASCSVPPSPSPRPPPTSPSGSSSPTMRDRRARRRRAVTSWRRSPRRCWPGPRCICCGRRRSRRASSYKSRRPRPSCRRHPRRGCPTASRRPGPRSWRSPTGPGSRRSTRPAP